MKTGKQVLQSRNYLMLKYSVQVGLFCAVISCTENNKSQRPNIIMRFPNGAEQFAITGTDKFIPLHIALSIASPNSAGFSARIANNTVLEPELDTGVPLNVRAVVLSALSQDGQSLQDLCNAPGPNSFAAKFATGRMQLFVSFVQNTTTLSNSDTELVINFPNYGKANPVTFGMTLARGTEPAPNTKLFVLDPLSREAIVDPCTSRPLELVSNGAGKIVSQLPMLIPTGDVGLSADLASQIKFPIRLSATAPLLNRFAINLSPLSVKVEDPNFDFLDSGMSDQQKLNSGLSLFYPPISLADKIAFDVSLGRIVFSVPVEGMLCKVQGLNADYVPCSETQALSTFINPPDLSVVMTAPDGVRSEVYTGVVTNAPDATPPAPGNSGTVTISNISAIGAKVAWAKATDVVTAQTNLKYKVYVSTVASDLATAASAAANGTLKANIVGGNFAMINGLTAGTQYYVAVVASDDANNEALYNVTSFTPVAAPRAIFAGQSSYFTCALTGNRDVKCWGYNNMGQLGLESTSLDIGKTTGSMTGLASVNLSGDNIVKYIATGSSHACALFEDERVKCWGNNSSGELGLGDIIARGRNANSMANLPYLNFGVNRTAKKLAAGSMHSCVILDDNSVRCWGQNSMGQLGYENTTPVGNNSTTNALAAKPPVNLGINRTAKALALGAQHTCALLDNDAVKCWGSNSSGQLGLGSTATVGNAAASMNTLTGISFGAGRTAKAIAAGAQHTCAILDNDSLRCWGDNQYGQLGYDDAADRGNSGSSLVSSLTAIQLGAGRTAKLVAASSAHTCALLDDNTLKCWGNNTYGQLGYNDALSRGVSSTAPYNMNSVPTINLSGKTPVALALGASHTCATFNDNSVGCWGLNSYGQLGLEHSHNMGDGAQTVENALTNHFGAGNNVLEVANGAAHTCARLTGGQLKCWGKNASGQLGYSDTTGRGAMAGDMANLPNVNLGAGRSSLAVAAGLSHTCAIMDNQQVKCWGLNTDGQLGQGNTTQQGHNNTNSVANLSQVNLSSRSAKSIAVGSNHTCVILDTDAVKCWGNNANGQLGLGDTISRGASGLVSSIPNVNLGSGRTALSISAAGTTTCALLDNNSAKCWGYNTSGQLGQNNTTVANNPSLLSAIALGGGTPIQIASGANSTCARFSDGSLKCWGLNTNGQLGYSDATIRGSTAGSMSGLSAVNVGGSRAAIDLAVGSSHTCALFTTASAINELLCWGLASSGQLGTNDSTMRGNSTITAVSGLMPIQLGTGRTAVKLATMGGSSFTCAILDNGAVKCFGSNTDGQLGVESTKNVGSGWPLSATGIAPLIP